MKEAELFPPLEEYLTANGYNTHAEVNGVDIVAIKNDEIIAVELKIRINLELILQGVDRQKEADSVYLAVPAPKKRKKFKREFQLLKRLGLGLIYIKPDSPLHKVEIIFHPGSSQLIKRKKKREAIIREVSGRLTNYNIGGSHQTKIMTAYRQRALMIACYLKRLGPSSPAALKKRGAPPDTGPILYNNFYGWFEHIGPGLYGLHKAGLASLGEYPEIEAHFNGCEFQSRH